MRAIWPRDVRVPSVKGDGGQDSRAKQEARCSYQPATTLSAGEGMERHAHSRTAGSETDNVVLYPRSKSKAFSEAYTTQLQKAAWYRCTTLTRTPV